MNWIKVILLLNFSTLVFAESVNDFESLTVGFKISKPAEWHFATADQNKENLKNIKLDDSEFKKLMVKYSTAPLVVMTKYPIPYKDLNPSFKVLIKPFGNLKDKDPKKIQWLLIRQLKKVFKDFKLDQEPMMVKVGELEASYMRIHYTLEIPDGRAFATSSEMWIIPRGDFFFMLGAGTSQDENTGTLDEIKQILNSVVIQANTQHN